LLSSGEERKGSHLGKKGCLLGRIVRLMCCPAVQTGGQLPRQFLSATESHSRANRPSG
jgi:hypothetical protein